MATNRSSRQRATLERLTVQQLLEVFETAVQTGRVLIPYNDLAEAWEILFSKLFLSAGELVQCLESGDQTLPDGKKSILREFVKKTAGTAVFLPSMSLKMAECLTGPRSS